MSLAESVLGGDIRSLARAASLIEAQTGDGRELSKLLFPATGHALTIGLTGAPGVGKSTLVNRLITAYRGLKKTVGVIAVDPSSPYSNGALLGDRVRMLEHHADRSVFIRSMASRGRLGGVAAATMDLILLMDAAGRDVILVETVGVGQDEIDIAHLAEITLVVLAPGSGDDIQAIKAGILEIADILVVNKADLAEADRLLDEMIASQRLAEHEITPVVKVSAASNTGISELVEQLTAISTYKRTHTSQTEVWKHRLRLRLLDDLRTEIPADLLSTHAQRISEKIEDPQSAIMSLRREWLARQDNGNSN